MQKPKEERNLAAEITSLPGATTAQRAFLLLYVLQQHQLSCHKNVLYFRIFGA
jgi:hypothetical protein